MLQLDMQKEHTVNGFWVIHFTDGKKTSEISGTLHYHPQNGTMLKLLLKTLNEQYPYDFWFSSKEPVEIQRIVGNTDKGKCFLLDTFVSGAHSSCNIMELNIYTNIVSFVGKSGQKVGDEYDEYDLQTEDEKVFYKCTVEFDDLFQWLSQSLSISKDEHPFYVKCLECTNVQIREEYRQWISCKLEEGLELTCSISESVGHTGGGIKDVKPFMLVSFHSTKLMSIKTFIRKIWELQLILSVFMSSDVLINWASLQKNTCPPEEDEYEECDLLYVQPERQKKWKSLYYTPVLIASKEEFILFLQNAFSLFKTNPDFFADLKKIPKEEYLWERLVSLVQIADAVYSVLGESVESSYHVELRERLKQVLVEPQFRRDEIQRIIDGACNIPLRDKLIALVEKSITSFGLLHPENYKEIIKKASIFRHKVNHGVLLKESKKIKMTPEDAEGACVLLHASIYSLFLQKIGVEHSLITSTLRDRLMWKHSGLWRIWASP